MMRFVFIVILGLGVVLCSEGCVNAQVTILADLGVSEEDYCYHTKMGRALYKGISNKHCVCDGSLVEVFPDTDEDGNSLIRAKPYPGRLHDSSDVYCKGKIVGYKFYYRDAEGTREFDTLQEWDNFCNTLAKNQEDCFDNLSYTKATIDYYDNKNTNAIEDYYNNKKNKKNN
ncbi:MAG: hypothetical protein V1925_02205 [Candidatus Omnitrophota bacterium]